MGTAAKIVLQAFAITAAAAVVAIAVDLARPGGIPLVADAPYEIFAPCRDFEAHTRTATEADLEGRSDVLYVDARTAEDFAIEHVEGAVSAPYSVLFGAAAGEIDRIKAEAARRKASKVVVYGTTAAPDAPGREVDLAQPLAAQLSEAGVAGAGHAEGGLAAMKKAGLRTVKNPEGAGS
ncbi:MAG: rhodanese-like domain-containing protein [Deltaproteobacteria bacterium]|nr:rhodanese-like domain-containing protein [Deltaproteobacteria bacterium]